MSTALVWFRQDLRCNENPALSLACNQHTVVIPLYIYDEASSLGEAQKWWLHHSLLSLQKNLKVLGLNLFLRQGDAITQLLQLIDTYAVETVYWNFCYEPLALKRDEKIKQLLSQKGIAVKNSNANLLFKPWEIKNTQGNYFKVFTPYWKYCQQQIKLPVSLPIQGRPSSPLPDNEPIDNLKLLPCKPNWAFAFKEYWQPGEDGALKKLEYFINFHLQNYITSRDQPGKDATSRLSPHLHFGEISPWKIWQTIKTAQISKDCNEASAACFLSELGWREFSYHLLYHFPKLDSHNFRGEFDNFPWTVDEILLTKWQQGMTGYPIIDAGMRELWQTGYMHNRVRMIVASFLTKDLLLDWRVGASWFWNTLLDADVANNAANWQWVAGSGADAAPYFRIFNPVLQGEKYDPEGIYIRKWVPELCHITNKSIHKPWLSPNTTNNYPKPCVDHQEARLKALSYYQTIKRR